MSEDYYKTLGVNRTATQREIKKAWRKRAKELHPDVNPDAEEEMKRVNLAYDVLKDPKTRQEYDNPNPFEGGGFNPFSGFGGRHAGFGDQQQMNNISTAVGIPIDILINGGNVTIPVNIPQMMSGGGGFFNMAMTTVRVPIKIDPNTRIGHRITIPKEQHNQDGIDTIVFELHPEQPKDQSYQVNNLDLIIPWDINVIDAMVGAQTEVTLPTGDHIRMTIPKNLQSNQSIRVASKGLTDINGNIGDVFLIVNLNIPEISDEQRDKIKTIFSV